MADVVLEDAAGGMPPATAQTLPQAPQPQVEPPPPDLTQPLADPDDAEEPPAPGDDDLPEGEEPQPQGRRSVVGDLVRERERRQTVENNLQQSQELLRQVMSLPGGMELLQAATTGQPLPRRPGEMSAEDQALVQEAQEVAQDLGLYDANGHPDLKTAARIVFRDRKRTETMVRQALGPLQQQTLSLAAQPVINRVLGVAEQFGIDKNLVWQGLQATPPEHLNNPEVQQAVLMMALGTQTMLQSNQSRATGTGGQQPRGMPLQRMGARPPIFTEAPGGRPRASAQLDDVFRERLRSTGMKDETINASLANFVPGAPNRLE